ncbi:MAG: glycosyltransferase [Desulfobacteraceae bacterium]|nr:glycosyltransferase [Desulfobacteraceae bacterium]MBC2719867.1 glycosyltransferase [Desulfobacteraceae bacterium]
MKISIITPSFNSSITIGKAIQSVLAQGYANYEHIIVDGGSTDGTLDILKCYPHLKWVSEPDRGQIHAMNKGFSMATGAIIGYLNTDDYYLEDAFSAVIPHFQKGAEMVMGKVLVRSEKPGGIHEWTCDPKTDFPSVLRHWKANAFCVNPVGYFYLRKVQKKISLKEKNGAKHDLAFLIETAMHFSIKKVDVVLGVFNHAQETQTGREQLMPSYWQPENFVFVDRLAANLSEAEQKQFRLERDRGYQLRRQWTVKEAFDRGMAQKLFDKGEVFMLPEDENECAASRCGFVEHDRVGTKGDWIIPVMTMGKVASKSICHTLKNLSQSVLPAQCYHIHQMNPATIYRNLPGCLPALCHPVVGLSLKSIFNNYNSSPIFKFIAGVRDPIAGGLSGIFEINKATVENIESAIFNVTNYILTHFDIQYKDTMGIDVYKYPFNHKKGYTIIRKSNIEVLVFRFEDLSRIFSPAMEEFFGIPNLKLSKINISSAKHYSCEYENAKQNMRFNREQLEKIYSHEMVKHFYTDEEISRFYNKWLQKRG